MSSDGFVTTGDRFRVTPEIVRNYGGEIFKCKQMRVNDVLRVVRVRKRSGKVNMVHDGHNFYAVTINPEDFHLLDRLG